MGPLGFAQDPDATVLELTLCVFRCGCVLGCSDRSGLVYRNAKECCLACQEPEFQHNTADQVCLTYQECQRNGNSDLLTGTGRDEPVNANPVHVCKDEQYSWIFTVSE